jgi:hypothetical protein
VYVFVCVRACAYMHACMHACMQDKVCVHCQELLQRMMSYIITHNSTCGCLSAVPATTYTIE